MLPAGRRSRGPTSRERSSHSLRGADGPVDGPPGIRSDRDRRRQVFGLAAVAGLVVISRRRRRGVRHQVRPGEAGRADSLGRAAGRRHDLGVAG